VAVEADVVGREADAFSDHGLGRRGALELFGKLGQLEIGEERVALDSPHQAMDVADLLLEHDCRSPCLQKTGRAHMGEQRRSSDRRMPREGQFARRREDPNASRVGCVPRLEYEHCLGKVEFGRDRLHAAVIEPLRVEHHGKRIAGERRLGEDVKREEAAPHRRRPARRRSNLRPYGKQQPGTVKLFGSRSRPRWPTKVWSISGMRRIELIVSSA
jgi:hypothetical protein